MKSQRFVVVLMGLVLSAPASAARAEITLDSVAVGNARNAADSTGYGAVDHTYAIGKYEVTAGQYTVFLNAVARTDTYYLYDESMSDTYGCQIVRNGNSGNYTYNVSATNANRPVNYVDWGDAARFVNWLHNHQPNGAQGAGTTETGAYALNGATSSSALNAVTRDAGAKFWIPTEDEWYKAAYHQNDSVTGNYWNYPTSTDSIDTSMANYGNSVGQTTSVGTYPFSSSYGTFDQGGNVWEWNETVVDQSYGQLFRGARGGSAFHGEVALQASFRDSFDPTNGMASGGFRVASVPEPSSVALMVCGVMTGLFWWSRRK